MWEIFRKKIVNSSPLKIILGIFNLFPFYKIEKKDLDFLIYLWPVYNEIFFFIITSIIIFFAYNKRFRMDILIIILIFLLTIIKIIFSVTSKYYSTLYYVTYNFGFIFTNPIYNFNYFLIGVFFGMNNFIIQKNFSDNEFNRYNRPYFIFSFNSVNKYKDQILKKCKLYFFIISSILILFIFSFSNWIIIGIYVKRNKNEDIEVLINNFISSKIIQIFYSFDIEIVVYLCHSLAFLAYILGENFISNLLSSDYWNFLNKMYFNFILLINMVTLYVLYQSESRIVLNLFNCILYSIICTSLTIIFAFFSSIFFELPAKRIINFIKERNEENYYNNDEEEF
jgi:hypothetical protein